MANFRWIWGDGVVVEVIISVVSGSDFVFFLKFKSINVFLYVKYYCVGLIGYVIVWCIGINCWVWVD